MPVADLLPSAAVLVHGPYLIVVGLVRREGNLFAVGGPYGQAVDGIVIVRGCPDIGAVRLDGKDMRGLIAV